MIGSTKSAWVISSVLHAFLFALLLFGPSIRPPVRQAMVTGPVIEAVAIDSLTLDLQRIPDTPPTVIEKPVPDLAIKAAEDKAALDEKRKRERELEQQKAKEEADAKQQREEEKKQAVAEAAANKKLADDKAAEDARIIKEQNVAEDKIRKEKLSLEQKEAELAVKKKAEQEAAELAAKQKAEREAKEVAAKKAAEEKKKREAAEREAKKLAEEKRRKEALEAQMKAEQEAREKDMLASIATEERRGQAISSGLLARYQAEVVAKVTRYWNRPASAKEGLVCTVQAEQIPGGVVIRAKVLECNGDDAVKRSIENAVLQASPLPEPPDPTLFERNLIFTFAPE